VRGAGPPPLTVVESDRLFVNWADFPALAAAGENGPLVAHFLERSGSGRYDYDIRVTTSADGGRVWSPPLVLHNDGVAAEHGFLSFFPETDGVGAVWLDGRNTVGGSHDHDQDHGGGGAMTLRGGRVDPTGTPHDLILLDDQVCDCCQTASTRTASGTVVSAYRARREGEIRDIHVVRRVDDVWEAPIRVHEDGWEIPACPVNGPSLDAQGESVAVGWFTGAGDEGAVQVAFSPDGGLSWNPPTRVDRGAPLGRVDLLLLEDGSALVVWVESNAEGDAELLARKVSSTGSPGPVLPLETTSPARASGFPRMARLGNRVLLAWTLPAEDGGASTLRTAFLALP
jgi:hypothetical protein